MGSGALMEYRDDGAHLRFPRGFLWGSGTSAYQFEGGDYRCDWSESERRGEIRAPGRVGQATDFWNRFSEDIRLAAELGHDAMKISVEWARVEPDEGCIDQDAIAHYREMLMVMREVGIRPIVVAHHFTSPAWLESHGWWLGNDVPGIFARYAGQLVERLGDLADTWCTINEPALLAAFGYGTGKWPPFRKGWPTGLAAYARLSRAHNLAYAEMKRIAPQATVGICLNSVAVRPAPGKRLERLVRAPANWLANFRAADIVRGHTDFLGVQYYSRMSPGRIFGAVGRLDDPGEGEARTDMGWPIFPSGLYDVVRDAWKRYGTPIYVTENGLADARDTQREGFIRDHLAWLHRAMREGADVRGYLHWATTDNFEWLHGFEPRFGLIGIDYDTLERTVRPSARYYERICREGEVIVTENHPSLAP